MDCRLRGAPRRRMEDTACAAISYPTIGFASSSLRHTRPMNFSDPVISFCFSNASRTNRSQIPLGFNNGGTNLIFEHGCPQQRAGYSVGSRAEAVSIGDKVQAAISEPGYSERTSSRVRRTQSTACSRSALDCRSIPACPVSARRPRRCSTNRVVAYSGRIGSCI